MGRAAIVSLVVVGWISGPAAGQDADAPDPNGRATAFDVAKHGFNFTNFYQGDVRLDIPLIGKVNVGHSRYGLCGGMTFAALDSFNLEVASPRQPGDDPKPPASGTPLRSYIYQRQMDSLKNENWFLVRRLISWIPKPIESNFLTTGLRVLSDRQFKENVVREINARRPVPLCLVKADADDFLPTQDSLSPQGFTKNHQVLAIGYRFHAREGHDEWDVDVYDPNYPGEAHTLHLRARTQTPKGSDEVKERFRGLYVTPYRPERPFWVAETETLKSFIEKFKPIAPPPADRPDRADSFTIVSINLELGLVVAKDETGEAVEFNADPAILKILRVGQTVVPNPETNTIAVTLNLPSKSIPPPEGDEAPPAPVGVPSGDDENDDADPDPPAKTLPGRLPGLPGGLRGIGRLPGGGAPGGGAGGRKFLKEYEKAKDVVDKLGDFFASQEINVSLLHQHKYMINDCLGIKVSAGEFKLKLAAPSVRFENAGVVFQFKIDRISLTAIKLRMRPNAGNPLKLCSFSKAFEVGGAASDVSLTITMNPLLDLERCRVFNLGAPLVKVRIGNLNLKPLQNDLDKMAKNMVEDALTNLFNGASSGLPNQIIRTIDDILEVDCPGRPGGIAKGVQEAVDSAAKAGRKFTLRPSLEKRGRTGRIVVSYPQGSVPGNTHFEVHRSAEKTRLESGYGGTNLDLLPGSYDVKVSGKRVEGVTVLAGQDTVIHMGVLKVSLGGNTFFEILDDDKKTKLHSGYGSQLVGFPEGTYYMRVSGQLEAVKIEKDKVTEF